jgi:transporter family-2 protein
MFALRAFMVGILTATQSRLNGQLSHDLGNGYLAAVISFGSGLAILIFLNFISRKRHAAIKSVLVALKEKRLLPWETIGGMGGGFFVAVQSIAVPQIGVALFSISTIGGQTAASLLVDKWGVSPRGKQAITPIRIFVALATLLSVTISVVPSLRNSAFKWLPVVVAIFVGAVVSFQQAINGRVNEISKEPLSTALVNFIMGTSVLVIALATNLSTGGHVNAFPHQWWLYLGGTCGLIFIAVSAHVVKHLGILNFILFSVTGQLTAAIAIDWLFPSDGARVTSYLITGTVMTLLAIGTSRFFSKQK